MKKHEKRERWLSMLLSIGMTISFIATGSIAYAADGQNSEDSPDSLPSGQLSEAEDPAAQETVTHVLTSQTELPTASQTEEEGESVTPVRAAYALFPEGTQFTTADATGQESTVAASRVALSFAPIVQEDSQEGLMTYAETALNASYDGWEREFRGLTLIDSEDTSAAITVTLPEAEQATVYWPYPNGITQESAQNFTFQVVHFTIPPEDAPLEEPVVVYQISEDQITPTEYGLRFQTDGFSPYVLLWREKVTLTLVYDPLWQYIGVGTPDVTVLLAPGTEVDMTTLQIPGHESDSPVSWLRESGDASSVVTTFVIDQNTTLYAGGSISGSNGSLGGDTIGGGTIGGASDSTDAFHLSFNSNGGSYIPAVSLTGPTQVDFDSASYTPTREGYTFTGWYSDFDLTTKLSGSVLISAQTTVWAGWKEIASTEDPSDQEEPQETDDPSEDNSSSLDDKDKTETVTLTLVYDPLWQYIGGDQPDVILSFPVGTEVDMTTLQIPGHEEDEPRVWMTESGTLSSTVTQPILLTTDTTLYAGSTISGGNGDSTATAAFHLSYHSNGGSYIKSRSFTQPTEVDFDDPEYYPTREGYAFTGWYTDFDLTERLTGVVKLSSDTTVVAGWDKQATLTLVYDPAWQVTGSGTPDVTMDFTVGTKIDMTTLSIPDHEQDVLMAWFEEAGNTTSLVTDPFILEENKTLYAGTSISGSLDVDSNSTVTPAFYLIYNSNEGSSVRARMFLEPTLVDFDDTDYAPTREGYTFTGWYSDRNLTNRLTGTVEISSDTTVWAGWKVKEVSQVPAEEEAPAESEKQGDSNHEADEKSDVVTLTLVYDPNWKTTGFGTPDVIIEMATGTKVDLTTLKIPDHESDPVRAWYEDADDPDTLITQVFTMAESKTIYAGAAITSDGGEDNSETTATAFTLTYQSNGGSAIEARSFSQATGIDFDDASYIPTREGYTFTGWYADSTLKSRLVGTVRLSSDTTVWAGWEKNAADTASSASGDTNGSTANATGSSATRAVTAAKGNAVSAGTSTPNTGDPSNLALWAVSLLASALGIAAVLIFRKKRAK